MSQISEKRGLHIAHTRTKTTSLATLPALSSPLFTTSSSSPYSSSSSSSTSSISCPVAKKDFYSPKIPQAVLTAAKTTRFYQNDFYIDLHMIKAENLPEELKPFLTYGSNYQFMLLPGSEIEIIDQIAVIKTANIKITKVNTEIVEKNITLQNIS